jgi:formate hydrogenlyase transcriptional activator
VLAEYFLLHLQKTLGRRFDGVERESMDRLTSFGWPGNIRQLENVIEHAAIMCDNPLLKVPPALMTTARGPSLSAGSRLAETLRHSEEQLIEQALEDSHGRVAGCRGAAARLGIPASTLESKIRRSNIDKLRLRTRQNWRPDRD